MTLRSWGRASSCWLDWRICCRCAGVRLARNSIRCKAFSLCTGVRLANFCRRSLSSAWRAGGSFLKLGSLSSALSCWSGGRSLFLRSQSPALRPGLPDLFALAWGREPLLPGGLAPGSPLLPFWADAAKLSSADASKLVNTLRAITCLRSLPQGLTHNDSLKTHSKTTHSKRLAQRPYSIRNGLLRNVFRFRQGHFID